MAKLPALIQLRVETATLDILKDFGKPSDTSANAVVKQLINAVVKTFGSGAKLSDIESAIAGNHSAELDAEARIANSVLERIAKLINSGDPVKTQMLGFKRILDDRDIDKVEFSRDHGYNTYVNALDLARDVAKLKISYESRIRELSKQLADVQATSADSQSNAFGHLMEAANFQAAHDSEVAIAAATSNYNGGGAE
jgi:hypothetical protein